MGSSKPDGDHLTVAGYWAEIAAMGLQRVYQSSERNWIARDRNGLLVAVRDPEALSPEERRVILDDLAENHVGSRH